MNKLIIAAFVVAFAAVASSVGIGGLGYGYVGGLTKLPNLGWGNIASVNSNQNIKGLQLVNVERGPTGIRSHIESKVAPVAVVPNGLLGGVGLGLGGLGGVGLGGIGLGGAGLGLGLGGLGVIG